MWSSRQVIFFGPLLLALTMGATDCEYFSNVVVPSSDSSPPITYDGVWQGGDWQIIRQSGNSGFTYPIQAGEHVIAIASGIDPQGLRKLTMYTEESWSCCSFGGGENVCSSASPLSVPRVETQAGTVGSTVSTGIWTGVDVGKLPGCQSGWTLMSYRFKWRSEAENFHGGKVTSATHQIVYVP
jgi:hypothetical protein